MPPCHPVWSLFSARFFYPSLIPVLVLKSKEILHWRFHLVLVIDKPQAQRVSHGSEQVIIHGSLVWTVCWVKLLFCFFFDTSSCLSRGRTPSLKLQSPLGYWCITNAGSEPWIGVGDNLRELVLYYMLGGGSIQFTQVFKVYSGN